MSNAVSSYLLPSTPAVPEELLARVQDDFDRFAKQGLPRPLDAYLADRYLLDLRTQYAGFDIPNPWGKASGQLSMTAHQVQEDVEAGLGFVVLKTVVAEDRQGGQSMQAWAVKESRMLVEPIIGKSGERGWTVSWKGRGWWQSFDEYLQLVADAQRTANGTGTLIVPSCKFHLPTPTEHCWKTSEYEYTVERLLKTWRQTSDSPMPLEKDFSPTLAGSDRAAAKERILEWLRTVPRLVREATPDRLQVRLGMKIFNSLFDDDFQLDMLQAIHYPGPDRPDFYVYANRLFDPDREFEGHRGIAYGGPDLSDRNLRTMTRFQQAATAGEVPGPLLPWSATGNITTGRIALEYALRGGENFQLHTFFQLPGEEFPLRTGNKTEKALHALYFHPQTGFIVWMHHLAGVLGLSTQPLRFRDVIGRAAALADAN